MPFARPDLGALWAVRGTFQATPKLYWYLGRINDNKFRVISTIKTIAQARENNKLQRAVESSLYLRPLIQNLTLPSNRHFETKSNLPQKKKCASSILASGWSKIKISHQVLLISRKTKNLIQIVPKAPVWEINTIGSLSRAWRDVVTWSNLTQSNCKNYITWSFAKTQGAQILFSFLTLLKIEIVFFLPKICSKSKCNFYPKTKLELW